MRREQEMKCGSESEYLTMGEGEMKEEMAVTEE